jgi:hypothetical protein
VRIMSVPTIAAAALIALAAPALAEVPPATPVPADTLPGDTISADTVRLSPDQREAALEYGASRSSRELPINGLSRQIHGEVGMEIGSNGSHAILNREILAADGRPPTTCPGSAGCWRAPLQQPGERDLHRRRADSRAATFDSASDWSGVKPPSGKNGT